MARKSRKLFERLLDAALPAAVLAVLAIIGYMLFVGQHRRAVHEPVVRAKAVAPVEKPAKKHESPRSAYVPPAKPVYKARVAIVIDDLGSNMAALDRILSMDAPVSVAVLPDLPNSKRSAQAATGAGRDVLLHLPMQPKGESMKGLGPGALMDGMDTAAMRRTIEEDLASVPGVEGVNNHMGSSLTENREAMAAVMKELGIHGLFFLDSRTSPASVAVEQAREHGIPAASRNVFLDDSSDEADIRQQFDRLARLSLMHGEAIAIGHPRPATLKVLAEELPVLRAKGIEVVGVSSLAK